MPTGKVNGTFYYKDENGEYHEITEVKFINDIRDLEQEKVNYEAWKLLEELLNQIGCELVPSEETARKIAEMEKMKNGRSSNYAG